MYRKLINRLLLFLLLLLTWLDLSKFQTLPTGNLSQPVPILPELQINLLQASQQYLIEDALRETKKQLLNYFIPNEAHYPWEVDYVFLNLMANPEPEVAFVFGLPPEKGIIVILQKRNNFYYLAAYQEYTYPLYKPKALPFKETNELLLAQGVQKNREPLFLTTTFIKIWDWQENKLAEVFTEKIKEKTKQPWAEQTIKLTYQHSQKEFKIQTQGKRKLAQQNEGFQQTFTWDDTWQRFILKKGHYLPPDKTTPLPIAILKDLSYDLEALLSNQAKYYQIITPNQETLLVKKDRLQTEL